MLVFVSWSGERSKAVAEELKAWLTELFAERVKPWVSSEDIAAGARWERELDKVLAKSKLGILCITDESLRSAWVMFEAGALGKASPRTPVVPYLVGLDASSLPGPLRQFQTAAATKEGSWNLANSVNGRLPLRERVAEPSLRQNFDTGWTRFAAVLATSPLAKPPAFPRELKLTFLGRQEGIGDKQVFLLRRVSKHAHEPGQMVDQRVLHADFRNEYDEKTAGGEIYYRLEQLRLLGFITRELIPGTDRYRYQLSAAYRDEQTRSHESNV